jgi:ATP-grasp in the biosynthetic pathway with Ter operon
MPPLEELPHPSRDVAIRRETAAPPKRVLLLTSLIALPYRVMRAARAAGAEIHVLGNERSLGLKKSRACASFTLSSAPVTGTRDLALADAINREVQRRGIDMVLPGDAQATRALIANRDLIEGPCFPLPDLAQFDFLNNKWRFTAAARELGLLTPKSWLAESAADLREMVESGMVPLPAIAKPVNHDGGLGVMKIEAAGALAQIARIDYAPIIVQEFISGRDIGASIYCKRGEVRSFIAHELRRATYRTLDDPRIEAAVARIAARFSLDGVYNFDMRLTSGGRIYWLECNPRFFFKIFQSMIAGVNFVAAAFGTGEVARPAPGASVRMPKALAAALPTPWRVTQRDVAMLRYYLDDPVSTLRGVLGQDWERPADAAERHFIAPAMEAGDAKDRALVA